MTDWTDYVSITAAVIGVVQAVFLCLILRSEGVRAFGANRWMTIFIAAIAINLVEDVLEQFVSADLERIFDLFFEPVNYIIAPAIYLYFLEISGRRSLKPWVHFALPLLVLNLIGWAIALDDSSRFVWSEEYRPSDVILGFCWTAIFIQISFYIALLWRVISRYFRQTQEQLGADRNIMRRWLSVILGGMILVFVTVVVGQLAELYLRHDTEMFGTEVAFLVILLAMSYEIATKPALFVMADWSTDSDGRTKPIGKCSEARCTKYCPEYDGPLPELESTLRPLLDEDGVNRALAQLKDIQIRGDILLDPLISQPKLARAVGLTSNQLSYVLNHHLGQNYFDFVNRARIAEARAVLLLEPDRTILDIALSVGFNSKSTFNLAFKKMTGETPSAVREAACEAEISVPDALSQTSSRVRTG